MELTDKRSVFTAIGCLMQQPTLFNNISDYQLDKDDFPEQFHKIVFAAIYNLWSEGITKIDYVMIDNYLSKYDLQYKIFIENNGIDYLQAAFSAAKPENFKYVYNKLKKLSLLRAYQEQGIDISSIYNPNLTNLQQQERMQEKFDNLTLVEIGEAIDTKIVNIKKKFLTSYGGTGKHAGDGIEDLKEGLKINPEVGLPLNGGIMNMVSRGARLKKFYMRSSPTGLGKAIPNDTFIPTPLGQRKVKDILPGDYLFGQDGKPIKVLQIHPQLEEKEIWEVIFADGRRAECCKDHLWEYKYHGKNKRNNYRVETVEKILERTKLLKGGFRESRNKGWRFSIRLNSPVEYKKKEYDIDPYIMGLILGDGSFRYDKTNKAFTFSTNDEELVKAIATSLKVKYSKNSEYNHSYTFKLLNSWHDNLWVEELLESYPLLWNVKSENKFIPQEYLEGNIEQRYALLQGLLDTDGSIDNKGRVTFYTVSPFLRDQIIILTRSLGMITTYGVDKRSEKYTTGECYYLIIQCKKEDKIKLFKLKRKIAVAEKYVNNGKRAEHKDHLSIINIKPTKKKTQMTCFTVDSKDHLFLMNDFIVTHNTRLAIADAAAIGTDEIYDTVQGKWVKNGIIKPALLITTELEIEEIQTPLLAYLSGINESKILDGEYQGNEEARINYAMEVLKRGKIWIEYMPNYAYYDIENVVKRYYLNHKVEYVFFDYLHTTMKMLSEIGRESGIRLREDNILYMFSNYLKDLCNELGIFIYTSTQVSADWETKRNGNQNLLRGAKSLADNVLLLII